jgi:myosin heavy subunit
MTSQSNSQSKQNFKAAAIVAIIALLGLNIFQFFRYNSLSQVSTQQEEELVDLEMVRAELEKEYYEAQSSLEELKSNNAELNELITAQQAELTDQKERITRLLRDSRSLAQARQDIAALKDQAAIYVDEINKLKEENEQLTAANVGLTEEREVLSSSLTSAQMENEQLQTARTALLTEKEELAKEKGALKVKVDEATMIPALKVDADGIFFKGQNNVRKTSRANKSEGLQICFDAGKNNLAEKGDEEFHFRVIDPIGETIAIENAGSGVFHNMVTNQNMRYSFTRTIEYTGEEEEFCFLWTPNAPLQKGTYEVEVYNKGFLAGKEAFKLR